jgi:hypothetical protein
VQAGSEGPKPKLVVEIVRKKKRGIPSILAFYHPRDLVKGKASAGKNRLEETCQVGGSG